MTRRRLGITRMVVAGSLGLTFTAAAAPAQFLSPRFQYIGTFPVAVGESAGRQAFAFGDLNGDQRPDLVAVAPAAGRVDVWRNQGGGAFQALASPVVSQPRVVALVDVTTPAAAAPDGILDLLVGSADGHLSVLPGIGDGTFGAAVQTIAVAGLSAVVGLASGEFNGQAGVDLALISPTALALLCSNASGALQPCGDDPAPDLVLEDFIEILPGDFDGDGRRDLVVLSREAQRLVPLYGNGDATFEVGRGVAVDVEAGDGKAVDMATAHLDEDATDDVLVVNRAENFEYLAAAVFGRTNRTLRVQAFVADFRAAALVVDDFDGEANGAVDVIIGYEDRGPTVNVGDGGGVLLDPFTPVGSNRIGGVGALIAADLDGDSKPDIAVLSRSGTTIAVLLNASGPLCAGDCNASGAVSIDELTRAVSIVLGERDPRDCVALDQNGNGNVSIAEVIAAVGSALNGCPDAVE
ncbi:MAG: VCBS repeat-containing protein [bacterium]